MKRFCPCFVKDMSDSSEQELQSAHVLPALSPQCSKCFCGEPSHSYEDNWIVDWEPYYLPHVFESWDCLRYRPGLNCTMKRGTEVFQSESRGELQVSLGDKYEDTGEPDQPSPSLLRKNGLELETCEGKDFPDQDSAPDSPRCLDCCPSFHMTWPEKMKKLCRTVFGAQESWCLPRLVIRGSSDSSCYYGDTPASHTQRQLCPCSHLFVCLFVF